MNKRKVKKKLYLNNKEFQVLFRSDKKYFIGYTFLEVKGLMEKYIIKTFRN